MNMQRKLTCFGLAGLLASAAAYADPRSDAQPAGTRAAVLAMPAPDASLAGGSTVAAIGELLDNNAARISFQALLTDNLGNPLAGTSVNLVFALYPAGGGAAIETIPGANYPMNGGIVQAQIPVSADSFDGSGRELGVTVSGQPEMSPHIPLTSVPYAFRVNRVASAELDDDIDLGDATTSGTLRVFSGLDAQEAIIMDGPIGQLRVNNPIGDGGVVLQGTGGLMATFDPNNTLIGLYGHDGVDGGAACLLGTPTGSIGLELDGHNQSLGGGGHVVLYDIHAADAIALEAGTATVRIGAQNGGSLAGKLHMYPTTGAPSRIFLDGQAGDARLGFAGESSGDLTLYSASGGIEAIHANGANRSLTISDGNRETVQMYGNGADGGGLVYLNNSAGTHTVELDGDEANHGAFRLYNSSGHAVISATATNAQLLLGSSNGGGASGDLHLYTTLGAPSTIHLDGETGGLRLGWPNSSNGTIQAYSVNSGIPAVTVDGGNWTIHVNDPTRETIRLDGNENGGGSSIFMWNGAGTNTVEIDADESDSAIMRLRDSSGSTAITLAAATGRTTTRILTITGGADIAEPFDVRSESDAPKPGQVVCIDPKNPGKLVVSSKAYDRTVAGVISGAGGVNPGMVMSQGGSIADGEHPVALTGRVYVWADATTTPIEVGDLLTTSGVAGHAAKVVDHQRAQGAILGKAMTPLAEGQGLILVLVSLQ